MESVMVPVAAVDASLSAGALALPGWPLRASQTGRGRHVERRGVAALLNFVERCRAVQLEQAVSSCTAGASNRLIH